jgi:hypothetical protein
MLNIHTFSERIMVIITPFLIITSPNGLLSCISATVVIIYYLAKMKIEIINTNYEGSWEIFFKSIITKKKK